MAHAAEARWCRPGRRRAPTRSRHREGALALATLALAGAGCASHLPRPAELDLATREVRYQAGLREREARGSAVDLQLLLWAEAPVGSRFPGAEARLLVAAPDAFRLRVASLVGTALDLGGRAESLSAYIPSRRRGLSLDAIRDSLGVERPAALVVRAASATWHPPERAWEEASWRDSLLELKWMEGDDSLTLAVGGHGLPVRASLTRPLATTVRVDYRGWDRGQGLAWPSRFEVTDLGGGFRLACKVTRVRFLTRPDSLRLAVRMPAGTVQLTLAELRRALERMGAL